MEPTALADSKSRLSYASRCMHSGRKCTEYLPAVTKSVMLWVCLSRLNVTTRSWMLSKRWPAMLPGPPTAGIRCRANFVTAAVTNGTAEDRAAGQRTKRTHRLSLSQYRTKLRGEARSRMPAVWSQLCRYPIQPTRPFWQVHAHAFEEYQLLIGTSSGPALVCWLIT